MWCFSSLLLWHCNVFQTQPDLDVCQRLQWISVSETWTSFTALEQVVPPQWGRSQRFPLVGWRLLFTARQWVSSGLLLIIIVFRCENNDISAALRCRSRNVSCVRKSSLVKPTQPGATSSPQTNRCLTRVKENHKRRSHFVIDEEQLVLKMCHWFVRKKSFQTRLLRTEENRKVEAVLQSSTNTNEWVFIMQLSHGWKLIMSFRYLKNKQVVGKSVSFYQ